MPQTAKALEGLKGVASTEVRYHGGTRGSVTFRYRKGETTAADLVRAVEKANPVYRVTVGDPDSVPPPTGEIDFRLVSSGGPYDLSASLARGKPTVVLFAGEGADWKLDALAQKRALAIRKVIVVGSADAQFQREFGARSLPYYRVYGADGSFLGDSATVEGVEALCPR